jgi:hypothetical protein
LAYVPSTAAQPTAEDGSILGVEPEALIVLSGGAVSNNGVSGSVFLPDEVSARKVPIEQAREGFDALSVEPGLSLPLSWPSSFKKLTVVITHERMEKRFLRRDVNLLEDKSESKDPVPTAGAIVLLLLPTTGRGKFNSTLDIVPHISPEIVVDPSFLLDNRKSGLSLGCEGRCHG